MYSTWSITDELTKQYKALWIYQTNQHFYQVDSFWAILSLRQQYCIIDHETTHLAIVITTHMLNNISPFDKDWKLSRHSLSSANSITSPLINLSDQFDLTGQMFHLARKYLIIGHYHRPCNMATILKVHVGQNFNRCLRIFPLKS